MIPKSNIAIAISGMVLCGARMGEIMLALNMPPLVLKYYLKISGTPEPKP